MRGTLLVDLDGTLIDPAEGIIASYRHGLQAVGATAPPAEQLGWVIGPPLRKTFATLVPPEAVEPAVSAYRAHFSGGAMYRARVYAGIPEALATLREADWQMHVCTVKPHVFAVAIAERLGLSHHFDAIHGAELDGRFDDKADLIAHILAESGASPADCMMIGDRDLDVVAARRNGVRTIGVTWGYGSREELTAANAAQLCSSPAELPGAVAAVARG